MNDTISISEKIYLLAVHPQKGGIVGSAQNALNYVLIGTLLLELHKNGNIDFENNRVRLLKSKSENRLHQLILDKISGQTKNLKISSWIGKLSYSARNIQKEIRNNLADRRIIQLNQKRFLFFRWMSPAILNFQLVYRLVADVESQILKGTTVEDELILLSFLKPAGLLTRLFPDREKRKLAQKKLKEIMAKNQVSMAVSNAISASQAVIASVTAVTAATAASR